MNDITQSRRAFFEKSARALFEDPDLDVKARRAILTELVAAHWGALPPFSTLEHPVIEDVQKATVGGGVVPSFIGDDGRRKVVLLQPGPHYEKSVGKTLFMIPGGFLNLTHIEGSTQVPPEKNKPENPRVASARETEEELQTSTGPLLSIDPRRLKPLDTDMLTFPWGEKRLVLSMLLELTASEVTATRQHVNRMATDPIYQAASAARTINKFTKKAEVIGAKIFDLQEVIDGKVPLLNEDQRSLFQVLKDNFPVPERVVQPPPRKTRGIGDLLRRFMPRAG